jgi:tetratricopeptide (TPR) repeat protein
MRCLQPKSLRFETPRIKHVRIILGVAIALASPALWATAGRPLPPQESIRVEGTVRDTGGRPVPGASVFLQAKGGSAPLAAQSGADGAFALTTLHPGSYTVWAEKAGGGKSVVASLALSPGDARRIDLVLLSSSTEPPSATGQPSETSEGNVESTGEPSFTVAGLTDWTNAGGHGSDVHLLASEALAKETLTLEPERGGEKTLPGGDAAREKELRENVARAPDSFAAHHALGEFCLHSQKADEAIAYLMQAYKINPADYSNAYELALAFYAAGDYSQAREQVRETLKRQDKAELHRLLGEIDERMNDPLGAVREYELAVRRDPSEPNYFALGAELLYHRAIGPAVQVLMQGSRSHPQSPRLLMGLAAALFARGSNAEAVRWLGEASELDPAAPGPYLFAGKMESAVRAPIPGAEEMQARFLRIHPDHAFANYYYALSLWKRDRLSHSDATTARVDSLLHRAIQLDPKLAEAYLQLGILYADGQRFPEAIRAFQQAIAARPGLEEAHYRLAEAYTRSGDESKAHQEFQVYEQVTREKAAQAQKQRRQIRQFVIIPGPQPPSSKP